MGKAPVLPPAVWADWPDEKLLDLQMCQLGVTIEDSVLADRVAELHRELDACGLVQFKPHFWLSDEWFSPDGVPGVAIPFYLAHSRLERLERTYMLEVEGGTPEWCLRILRHEAGHAIDNAYKLRQRRRRQQVFGPSYKAYPQFYDPKPYSKSFVLHLDSWYAQSHPDEDFAETFAVWLTPGLDWRREYAGWPALAKLEYVDRVLQEVGQTQPEVPAPTPDDLPVEEMHYTVEEHYRSAEESIPIEDEAHFDGDLRALFATAAEAPGGEPAWFFLRRHRKEIVGRIAYWTGETTSAVRAFVDFLANRAERLDLRVPGLEASTLIEVTAFGTAVMMNYRYTDALDGTPPSSP